MRPRDALLRLTEATRRRLLRRLAVDRLGSLVLAAAALTAPLLLRAKLVVEPRPGLLLVVALVHAAALLVALFLTLTEKPSLAEAARLLDGRAGSEEAVLTSLDLRGREVMSRLEPAFSAALEPIARTLGPGPRIAVDGRRLAAAALLTVVNLALLVTPHRRAAPDPQAERLDRFLAERGAEASPEIRSLVSRLEQAKAQDRLREGVGEEVSRMQDLLDRRRTATPELVRSLIESLERGDWKDAAESGGELARALDLDLVESADRRALAQAIAALGGDEAGAKDAREKAAKAVAEGAGHDFGQALATLLGQPVRSDADDLGRRREILLGLLATAGGGARSAALETTDRSPGHVDPRVPDGPARGDRAEAAEFGGRDRAIVGRYLERRTEGKLRR